MEFLEADVNAMMDVWSYKARHNRKFKIQTDKEGGGNLKESPGKEIGVVCDVKRGAICRKEGDVNGSTREKEEMKA